jgi:hypothetical protein
LLTNLLAVDARPHSPFAALLLSPLPFRAEVSGRAIAQPLRRCLTHLLPVRPTCVGRTDLTSQGAPRSVTTGEPCDRQRVCQTRQLPPDAESANSRRRPFLYPFPRVFALFGRQSRPLLNSRESGQTLPKSRRFPDTDSAFGPTNLLPSASASRRRVDDRLARVRVGYWPQLRP